MREIRLVKKIIQILVKDRMQYPGRFITEACAIFSRCGVLLVLYWYVFQLNGGVIQGTTYRIAAWSMFLYFAFSTLLLRGISRTIMRDVQSGNIEVLLNKPISYLTYRIWWQIGSGVYPFLLVSLVGGLTLALIIGVPQTMTIGIFLPTALLVFVGASILSIALYAIVGLLSFWIEDIVPIFWIVDKAVLILGGSYLPVAMFPPFMYKLSLYSPFGASQFITHTVYEAWRTDWPVLIGIQALWIVVLGTTTRVLFTKAREKVSVNGG